MSTYTEPQRALASRLQHLFNSGHPKHAEAECLRVIAQHDAANDAQIASGVLTNAGTMTVGDETLSGIFVRMTIDELRAIKYLPMYHRVDINLSGKRAE